MSADYAVVIAALGFLLGSVVLALVKDKKGGKSDGCTGCPNYNTCRAHIGCSNNPNNRK